MIPVNIYRDLWIYLASIIPGIHHAFTIHEESDMAAAIRDIDQRKVLLIVVLPSADLEATSADDVEEVNSCYVFLVQKTDHGSTTQDEFITQLYQTQAMMQTVKQNLIAMSSDWEHLSPYSHLLHGLVINGMHTDPEYNLLGCNGWGLSFKIKTKGINNI